MEMYNQRWNQPQAKAKERPGKAQQATRRSAVVEFRVRVQEAASEETRQRQTKKEEDTLEVALATMAQDHHHPKKWEECPRS
jgi:hypothetical protein